MKATETTWMNVTWKKATTEAGTVLSADGYRIVPSPTVKGRYNLKRGNKILMRAASQKACKEHGATLIAPAVPEDDFDMTVEDGVIVSDVTLAGSTPGEMPSEVITITVTNADPLIGHAAQTVEDATNPVVDPATVDDVLRMADTMQNYCGPYTITVSPTAAGSAVERVMKYATPIIGHAAVSRRDAQTDGAEDLAEQAARPVVHPKAADMIGRAAILAGADIRKTVPMPAAEQRTKPYRVDLKVDNFRLIAVKEEMVIAKDKNRSVMYERVWVPPQEAFAMIPRGTARKLRKALRAAGRPDLAAVSRLPPDIHTHGRAGT